MLEQFLLFIKKNKLFDPKERILLAVSGGIDSVVLAHLFHQANFNFAIAHCNFQLRGKESDKDEQFVKDLAKRYGVRFFSKRFDTEKEADTRKISIQMAARDLRYTWFNEIIKKEKYKYVAIAHHLNDSVETFFINLLRGTGIDGITGIKAKNSFTIRPLLFAERSEIENFAKKNKIVFREDASNLTDDYLRNKIRHQLIPTFKKLNPKFEQTMSDNMSHFAFANSFLKNQQAEILERFIKKEGHSSYILIDELKMHDHPEELLYELIHSYGFNFSQCIEILSENAATKSGKKFKVNDFRILRDREKIFIEAYKEQDKSEQRISKTLKETNAGVIKLGFSFSNRNGKTTIPVSNNQQWLDADLLKFPLTVRKWNAGDQFFPLGMKNRKKLSDFFTDRKMNIFEKEKTYVLTSENQIVCILGHRIDDRYKITDKTKRIFKVEVKETIL